jgi:hypothetical protein
VRGSVGVQVNCPPFPISLSFWVELVGACNSVMLEILRMMEIELSLRVLSVAHFNNGQRFGKTILTFPCFIEFCSLFMIFI